MIHRRDALRSMTLALAGLPLKSAGANRTLGLALYTVREALATRPSQVLEVASKTGYTEIEILRYQIATVRPF